MNLGLTTIAPWALCFVFSVSHFVQWSYFKNFWKLCKWVFGVFTLALEVYFITSWVIDATTYYDFVKLELHQIYYNAKFDDEF